MSSHPVIFSHSNPRRLWDHDRNILDDQARACAATGGLVGVVGVGIFMGEDDASTETFFHQIDYYAELIGPEHIALGLDYVYDVEAEKQYMAGVKSPAHGNYENMNNFFQPEQLLELTGMMIEKGYTEQTVRSILGENFLAGGRRGLAISWQPEMIPFILKRLFSAFLTLVLVSVFIFLLAHLAGDPAIAIAGKEASAEDIARIRAHYGFDKPLIQQYFAWCGRALSRRFRTVLSLPTDRRRYVADAPADYVDPRRQRSRIRPADIVTPRNFRGNPSQLPYRQDFALVIAVVGQAMPTFWFALVMIVFFGLTMRWLPISGNASWQHFIMPTIALGYFATPALMRLTRAGMIDALESDYIRTARAKGLSQASILFKHALRNVMIPVVSVSAVQFGAMLSGSIVVEQIFALQGIGWLSYDATVRSDLPVVQAITLVIAVFYVLLTLAADLLNALLDPRIRIG